MKALQKLLGGVLISAALVSQASASILAGNLPDNFNLAGQGADQNVSSYSQTFNAPSGATLQEIHWYGYHGPISLGSDYDNFIVTLDNVVQSGKLTVLPFATLSNTNVYEYILDVPDALLTATTLAILNDNSDVEWYWQNAIDALPGSINPPAGCFQIDRYTCNPFWDDSGTYKCGFVCSGWSGFTDST